MPIQLQHQSTQPNKTITFTFADQITSSVVGISFWDFRLSNNHVRTLELSLTTNQPDAHTISVRVNGTLQDDSGNGIINSSSKVIVSCVAVVRASDTNLVLAEAAGIPSGDASGPINLPGSNLPIKSAFVSGFDLSYPNSDNHVRGVLTAAGLTVNGNQGNITAQARMYDDSGNLANGTLNGGMIAATPAETGLLTKSLTNQTSSAVTVDLGEAISEAVVLIQTLDVEYGSSDNHISRIGGGTSGWSVDGQTVTLNDAQSFVSDGSGNHQDNGRSNVTMLVVAVP